MSLIFSDGFANQTGSTTVEAYGAKGDGVTDDTYAIQKAINSPSRTVIFSKKNYIVNGEIVLMSNKAILGNQATISRSKLNSKNSIFYGNRISNITINDIVLKGNVKRGISNYSVDAATIRILNSQSVNISNVYTSGGTSGVQVYYSNSINIDGLISENNILTGLSGICNNLTLSNSKITNNGYASKGLTHDVYFINSSNLEIRNSTFGYTKDQSAFSVVVRYDRSNAKALFDRVKNVKIFNNSFYKNGLAVGSDPGIAVVKRMPPQQVSIYGNNFNWSDLKIDDPENISTYSNKNINNYICRVASSYPGYTIGLSSSNDHCKNIVQSSLRSNASRSTKAIIFNSTIIDNDLSTGLQNAKGFGGIKAFTLKSPQVKGNVQMKAIAENSNVKINR